jgi:cytochrome P450
MPESLGELTKESLGTVYDPLGEHLEDPWPFYERAQSVAPIFYSPALKAWVVTRFEDVRQVLRDSRLFSSSNVLRPFVPFGWRVIAVLVRGYRLQPPLLMLDGEQHRRQRQPYADGFGADRVAAAKDYIEARAVELIDSFTSGRDSADLVADYANPLTVSAVCNLIGFAPEDHQALGDDTRLAAGLAMGHRFGSSQEKVAAAHAWVRSQKLIGQYVLDRRAHPRDDMISEVVAAYAPGSGKLTRKQEAMLAGELFGVAIAGHNTPSAAIADGVLQLLRHPDQWRLLCERPEMIPGAVEEVIRYCTPFHIFLRKTTQDTTLAGQALPKGAEVAVWLAAANRDKSAFPHADQFDVTRASGPAHIGFGVGRHFCVGAALAKWEVAITLRVLTERLPRLRLVAGQRIRVVPSLSQRGPASVRVTWI